MRDKQRLVAFRMCPESGYTLNLSVYRTMLQPTEPHRPGLSYAFLIYIYIYICIYKIYIIFFKFIYLFLERGEGKEKERQRNINVWLPLTCPLLGTQPATQACAPTGNQTSNPLVCRLALTPLNHTSQGYIYILKFFSFCFREWGGKERNIDVQGKH